MIVRSAAAFLILAPLQAAAGTAEREAGEWRAIAADALMPALRVGYPHVSDWAIDALVGSRQETALQSARDLRATVGRLGKRSAVRLSWSQDNRRRHAIVWFAVSGSQKGLSAGQRIAGRSPIDASQVELSEHEAFISGCTPISSLDGLHGMRTRRTLQPAEPVCAEVVEPRSAISRGEAVTVRSTAGAVTIVAKAVAQEDAEVGQTVRVKNPSSGHIYRASVDAAGEASVHE